MENIRVKLSPEIINFLEGGNKMTEGNTFYMNYPHWFKNTEVPSVFEVISEVDICKSTKAKCDFLYEKIAAAEEKLEEIRSNCSHERIFIGNYSYRVGNISLAKICSDCGKMLNYLTGEEMLNYPHKQLDLFKEEES